MRRAALLAMLLAPQLPAAALAQVTPEHAAALQAQLRDWLQTAVGPGLAIGQSPVDVTAAGDHFDLTYPLLTAVGRPLVTAKMTDAGNGRWSIDDVVVPSPSVFNYRLPPSKTGAPSSEVTTTLTIGKLQQQILLDPSFATPTTATSSYGDLSITTQLPGMTQLSHLDSAESHTTITPASDGRVDISGDTSAQGYTMKLPDPSDPQAAAIAVNIAGVSVITTLKDVSKEQGAQMLHLLVQFGQRADKTAGTKSPALDPATSLALLSALGDFAKSVVIAEKLDDMTVTAKGLTGTIKQLGLGLETKIVDGKAEARLPLSADGLTLPDLGLGTMVQLIPTHVSLTPSVSHVPTGALMQLSKAVVQKQTPDDQDMAALFSQGPIDAALDDIQIDLAGSKLAGHIAMVALPDNVSATGQITADNFDSLQQTLAADPQTRQAIPVAIFLKGIARAETGRLVWDVVYRDSSLLINGQDISAMMAPAPPPPPPPAAAPARPTQRPAPERRPTRP